MKTWNQCDECGHFISFQDLETNKATHRLLEPDSDLGIEKWETLCKNHNPKTKQLNE